MKTIYLFSVILFNAYITFAQDQDDKILDSLENDLKIQKTDTNKVKTLDKLSYRYSNINPEIGINYAEEALKISKDLNWSKGIGLAHLDLGLNYSKLSKHELSIENYNKSIEQFQKLNDKKGLASVYANVSMVYKTLSNYQKALENSFKAISLKEYLNPISVAIINENIGTIYLEQKNYEKTKQYYNKALEDYKKLNNKVGIARNLGNNGIVLDAQGKYDEALEFHHKSLKINSELGNKNSIQINYANIGYVYCHKKEYEKALHYQNLALNISKELKFKSNIAINTGNIGETYYFIATDKKNKLSNADKVKNLHQAISYLKEAITICKETNFVGPLLEYSQYISDAYSALNDYQTALAYYKLSDSLRKATSSENNIIEISKLEASHEIDLKNKDIIIKDKELLIARLNAENSRNDKIILIISIILILFISIYILRKLRKRNLKQKNKLERIAKYQAHDIRGPVATILGLVSTFNHEDPSDPVNKKVLEYLNQASTDLDNKIKNIINEASEEDGGSIK